MHILNSEYLRILLFSLGVIYASLGNAAAPVDCKKSINIRATQASPLNFGDLLVSGAGSAVIGTDSSRYTNGLVIPANGLVSAAELVVTGCKEQPYAISVQPSTTLYSATGSMIVDGFITNPILGLLDLKGKQSLFIGGTLHISAAQVAGTYSGSFLVEVIYQ